MLKSASNLIQRKINLKKKVNNGMKLKHNVPSLLKLVLKMKLYLQEELQVIATRFEQKDL